MKKMLFIILTLLIATANVQAYDYSYKNGTNKTVYFNPGAWGVTGQFSFFKGDTSANDGWSVNGPQILKPGEIKSYSFKGVWCHGGIWVGTSMNDLVEVPLYKANLQQYNDIIDNLTKASVFGIASPAVLTGAPQLLFMGAQVARFFSKSLCQNYHFIIGQQEDGSFFATATPW